MSAVGRMAQSTEHKVQTMTQIEMLVAVADVCHPVLGRWRQEALRVSVASRASLMAELQANG